MSKTPAHPAPSSGKGQPAGTQKGRSNTLGLTGNELDAILNHLDASSGTGANHRRQSARLEFRHDSVGVDIVQPGGGQTHINVACRNLSRTGLGFLHSAYIHVGTSVVLTLAHQNKAVVKVPARVVRCRHVTRHVHDVGVRFNEPINIRDFLSLDPLMQTFTCEVVDPAQLKGTLLVVAEYRIEQACVTSMLRETSVEIVVAKTIEEGLEHARQGVALILCDDVFEKGEGADFVKEARKCGVRAPIILMSADTSEAGLARIRRAEADAFLAKPLKQDLLLRAVAEFTLISGDKADASSACYSTLSDQSPMRDLAEDFINDLRSAADQIESLAKTADLVGIRKQCLRLGGPATSLGFASLAKLATDLVVTLDSTKSLDRSIVALNTFVSTCRNARLSPKTEVAPADSKPDEHAKAA